MAVKSKTLNAIEFVVLDVCGCVYSIQWASCDFFSSRCLKKPVKVEKNDI